MRFSSVRVWALAGLVLFAVGCSGTGDKKNPYRARQARPPLQVPPDLTRPPTDADLSASVADTAPSATHSRPGEGPPLLPLEKAQLDAQRNVLTVRDDLSRAWHTVGQALDQAGFVVEDRDEAKGLYYVRYNGPSARKAKRSIWSRWFKAKAQPDAKGSQYQVRLDRAGDETEVRVLDAKGAMLSREAARRLLDPLHQQLK